MPPALGDLPTDADYAMELISQRVAAGLPVKPSSRNSRKSTIVQDLADPASPIADDKDSTREAVSQENGVNWKKWGERTVLGKAWVQDGKRFIRGEQVSHVDDDAQNELTYLQREQELSPPPFQTRGSGMSAMSGKSGMSDARVLLEETHSRFPCVSRTLLSNTVVKHSLVSTLQHLELSRFLPPHCTSRHSWHRMPKS